MRARFWFWILISGLAAGCVSKPPVVEHALARAAIEAAANSDATKYSPNNWQRAKEAYSAGQKYLAENDNENARAQFLRAKSFAEKAENQSRYVRLKQGESP